MGLSTFVSCDDDADSIAGPDPDLVCDAGNGGITLPSGFCAIVVADLTTNGQPAKARHLVVLPNGDIFVAVNPDDETQPAFGIIGLRDTDGDGKSDQQTQFSPGLGGSGLAFGNGALYFGANDRVLRFTIGAGQMMPTGNPVTVVSGMPATEDHVSKTVVVNGTTLFVNIGSASNSCQVENREAQSPGVYPCPELPIRSGIWRFDANGTNQTATVANRFALGYRNMVALAINPNDGQLYGVQHGRDNLFSNWPQFFTAEESAELPGEEYVRITQGSDNGWPYCYYDGLSLNKKVLAPEYGGDGVLVTGTQGINCASYNTPLAAFKAHYAPNGLVFYNGNQFPARYRNGLFVAMHGSHNRSPLANDGYNIQFMPLNASGNPTGAVETFADGFDGGGAPLPANAVHRPVGFAIGPDGSLYISDDAGGRIWRVIHRP
jgi:glucose/arabinose dehydrogenase